MWLFVSKKRKKSASSCIHESQWWQPGGNNVFFVVVWALPAFVLPGQITQFTQSKSKMLKQCRGCAETRRCYSSVRSAALYVHRTATVTLPQWQEIISQLWAWSAKTQQHLQLNDFQRLFFACFSAPCGVCLGETGRENILFCFRIFLTKSMQK